MMRKILSTTAAAFLLLSLFGCKPEETSSSDSAKMKDAMAGKGYGAMPEETRKQMEEAMRKNMPAGQPKAGAKPATKP